jgi:hypothetical protein
MTGVFAHLLFNHVPPIGIPIGLAILLYGLFRRSDAVVRASLWLFVVLGAITVPVHMTGDPAEEAVERMPGVTREAIHEHEDAASLGLAAALALGVASLGGLLTARGGRPVRRGFSMGILALAVLASGIMTWVSHLGGQVRHTEIRPGAVVPAEREEPPGRGDDD